MECVQALSDGNLLQDEPDLDITLEDLSDCYGVEYSEELAGELVVHARTYRHSFTLILTLSVLACSAVSSCMLCTDCNTIAVQSHLLYYTAIGIVA